MSATIDCPNCGMELEVSLVSVAGNHRADAANDDVREYGFTIAGQRYTLTPAEVRSAAHLVHRPIQDVYVRISDADGVDRRIAVKELLYQALRAKYGATAPTGAAFTTQTPERVLTNLGFEVKRRR